MKRSKKVSGLHQTPQAATLAILQAEQIPHHVWEPAAGKGAIVNVLRAAGHTVWATDLNAHLDPEALAAMRIETRIDFLLEHQRRVDVECILTNPPFELGEKFAEHALFHAPMVVMLLPLTFLEGKRPCLDHPSFYRVYVFRNRIPLMHRDNWDGKKTTNMRAYAWFVWKRWNNAAPTVHRIDCPKIITQLTDGL